MAEQRNVPLESGGTIRITEAIMRGTGPQGPKGDKGDIGTGTIIRGSKELCATIKAMRADDGDGWICEEDGHLYVYDLAKEEAGEDPWVDCGKIVGPEGQISSLGAEWQTTTQQWIFDDDVRETTLKWDQTNYIDEEKVVAADGTEQLVELVTLGNDSTTTPYDKWNYNYSSWTTLGEVPVHIIDVDVTFIAQKTDGSATTHAGPVTIRLYKLDGATTNATWRLETVETRYMDSNEATHATMNLSWAGKTKHTDIFKVAIVSQVSGYVTWSRVQTARAGGNAGPPGVQGLKGDRGEQGEQGPTGIEGRGVSPTGTIIAFAGGPEDIPNYYERDGDNDDLSNDIQYDNTTGLPYVMATPAWLPCDGTTVPVGVDLRDLLGMTKTPNLMGRSLLGTDAAGWVKQGRLHRNLDLGATLNPHWDDITGAQFGGSNVLTKAQLPAHNHDITVKLKNKAGVENSQLAATDGTTHDISHAHTGRTWDSGRHRHHIQEHFHNLRGYTVKGSTHGLKTVLVAKDNNESGHKWVNVSAPFVIKDEYTYNAVMEQNGSYTGAYSAYVDDHSHGVTVDDTGDWNIDTRHTHSLDLSVTATSAEVGSNEAHQHPYAQIIYLIKT